MKKIVAVSIIPVVSILLMFSAVYAIEPWPEGCSIGSLPGGDLRYPEDQIILTCLPEKWNGLLIVYAHGYVPAQVPLSLPEEELTLSDGRTVPEILMSLGFAFATSSYHKNGYAVEQAGQDLNSLVDYFISIAPGPVRKTYITGGSEGGLITTMLLERFPEKYHGGLALCGPIGGTSYQVKYLGDFRAVFDYLFPNVFPFGIADVPPDAYLDWETTYAPDIMQSIESSPYLTEQLFKVTRAARDPLDPFSAIETAISVLSYSIWAWNDLKEVAGGQPFGNLLTWYRGSANDFLLNIGIERVGSAAGARNYLKEYYEPTGLLQRPLVTLHTTNDGLVPFVHELIYRSKTYSVGRSHYLTMLPVARYGHCNFTTQELLGAFALLFLQTDRDAGNALNDYLSAPAQR